MSTIKFCPICDSHMKKIINNDRIQFICACGAVLESEPTDALIFKGAFLYRDTIIEDHTTYIEQSAHDAAANFVREDCPQCGLDFLNLMRIGDSQRTVRTCICGYISNAN